MKTELFKVGDRVKRKKESKYREGLIGTIVERYVYDDDIIKCKVKWDEAASNKQQHSTVDSIHLTIV